MILQIEFNDLLEFILNIYHIIINFAESVLNFFNTPVSLKLIDAVVGNFYSKIFVGSQYVPVGTVPLYVLLFGGGISVVLVISVIRWVASTIDWINPFG